MTKKLYFDDYQEPQRSPHDFQVRENDSHFTGVYNAEGQPLYRHPEPVGFVTDFRVRPRVRVKALRG